jgi:hypothetical protein
LYGFAIFCPPIPVPQQSSPVPVLAEEFLSQMQGQYFFWALEWIVAVFQFRNNPLQYRY